MKSSHTYEMHNYAATLSTPNDGDADGDGDGDGDDGATRGKCHERVEKYSLRQRRKRRAEAPRPVDDPFGYASDNSAIELLAEEQLAPIASRASKASKVSKAKAKAPPAKTKAAPLSKYRRKTANARERTRMREINAAFETLRHCVPHTITGEDAATTNEKLTKITTLRMAMRYIRILDEALANPSFGADFLLECQRDGDHRFTATTATTATTTTTASHSGECASRGDNAATVRPVFGAKSAKCSAPFKAKPSKEGGAKGGRAKATPSLRRQSRRQKSHKCDASSPASSGFGDSYESDATYAAILSSASSAGSAGEDTPRPPAPCMPLGYASRCSSSSLSSLSGGGGGGGAGGCGTDTASSLSRTASELGTLLLDSDGESLHLSEHCLSPSYTSLIGGIGGGGSGSCSEPTQPLHMAESLTMSASALDNPLELSLRLLDSSTDPYFDQHPPPTCISPLATLDSLNPFADLLHPDFPAHTALDLFLT